MLILEQNKGPTWLGFIVCMFSKKLRLAIKEDFFWRNHRHFFKPTLASPYDLRFSSSQMFL
jgi:hypothetical protein